MPYLRVKSGELPGYLSLHLISIVGDTIKQQATREAPCFHVFPGRRVTREEGVFRVSCPSQSYQIIPHGTTPAGYIVDMTLKREGETLI